MAPRRPTVAWPHVIALVSLVATCLIAVPAHALKVATWNLLGYDDGSVPSVITPRQPYYRTVMAAMDPDVIIVQELITAGAADSFLTNVLNVVQPGQWTRSPWIVSTKPDQSVAYWKPAKVNVTNAIAVSNTAGPRDFLLCIVKPNGYRLNPGWFRLYSIHLKAGNTPTDANTRASEGSNLRTSINNLTSQGPNFVVGGDTNFYSGLEGGYIGLTQSLTGTNGNAGRCFDPLGTQMANVNWNSDPAFALYDTQSPCLGCPGYPNLSFSGGGMDDRFDILFTSYSLADAQGVDRVDYYAFGQDGQHFNGDINSPPTNGAVGQTVADALWAASDHLPVVTVLQLASRVVAPSAIGFGSVITGGSAQQTLNVSDGGTPPVDALDYSFSAPAGFTAPAGSFTVANGVVNPHTLGMDTSTPGVRSGTLTMSTDDPDSASKPVQLSGTVLDHAQPSLDSLTTATAGTLDWGTRASGAFGDTTVSIFDLGYGPLRARLSVGGAVISGGSGRFHLVGASFPSLVAGSSVPFTVHFDDSGASTDTVYQATLTFNTADEPLPGATALAPLAAGSAYAQSPDGPVVMPRIDLPRVEVPRIVIDDAHARIEIRPIRMMVPAQAKDDGIDFERARVRGDGSDGVWHAQQPVHAVQFVAEGEDRAAALVASSGIALAIVLPRVPVRQVLANFGPQR